MIKYLKDLPIGTTVSYYNHEYEQHVFQGDTRPTAYPSGAANIVWMVAAQDHFAPNTTTLWAYRPLEITPYMAASNGEWIGSGLQQQCEALYETFPRTFQDKIVPVQLETGFGLNQKEYVSVFSCSELSSDYPADYTAGGAHGDYLGDELKKTNPTEYSMYYWTRSKDIAIGLSGTPIREGGPVSLGFRPFINLHNDVIVTYEAMFGHHIMYEGTADPFGFVKVDGVWKPLYGTKPIERV